MTAPADLAEFRLLRALRGGQPGAFPSMWNAQAGAAWSVVRAMCGTDREAIGWMTSFRLDLAERAADFHTDAPVAAQVGHALYEHLRAGFRRGSALPPGPLTPDEAGVRRVPESERLIYLVDLFFDVTLEDGPEGGREVARRVDAVRRLLEPTHDTDARLLVHSALLRTPPVEALILPPGAEPPPPRPRWWMWFAGGAVLLLASGVALWVRPPARAEDVGALHVAAVSTPTFSEADPVRMGQALVGTRVPAALAEAPDLSALGLNLFGVLVRDDVVVLDYTRSNGLWTLQHHLRPPVLDGPVLATRATPGGALEARKVGELLHAVAWEEGGAAWVLSTADAPPDAVLEVAAQIREVRRASAIPFLGDPPPVPAGGHSD
ncbi:MAG: hypothetical protein ACOZNI_03265 [Myxococcota bacterium]